MRELRTILEGIFPAFYLELSNPGAPLETKLTQLRKLEESHDNHGKSAFQMSGVPEWRGYYDLYKELCSYTHLSTAVASANMRKVAIQGYSEIPDFHFDRELFVKCVEMWAKVCHLAMSELIDFGVSRSPTNKFQDRAVYSNYSSSSRHGQIP
jgi:hypothetical protein